MRLLILTTFFFGFVFTACTVNKRDPQTPPHTVKKVSTDFFFDFSTDRKSYKSKRFLFGSSIEDKTGNYSNIFMDHYNTSGSANIEFEFNTEGTKLVGKLVNPTYPTNKDKWEVFLTFDVSGSYYEENRVDPSGRQSQDIVRRSDKSDPRARPFIDIELSSLRFGDRVLLSPWAAIYEKVIQKIEDVEWSEDGSFLGFTAVSTSAALGSNAQTIDRINLLRIDPSSSDFEETPYNRENDKYTQIIDIVSERPNHFGEKLKAAHWDINSRTKKKHKIYLHNFPEEYLPVAQDSVESWNDVFEEVVGYRPLVHEVTDRKYAFDLRYHTIHWVGDIRLSAAGPLGLANMAADITNGKILWTGSIVWGGLIDQYASGNVPSIDLSDSNGASIIQHDISKLITRQQTQWNAPSINPPDSDSFDSDFIDYVTQSFSEIKESIIDSLFAQRQSEINSAVEAQLMTKEDGDLELERYKNELPNIVRQQQMVMSPDQLRLFYTKLKGEDPINDVDLDTAFYQLKDYPITHENIIEELGLKVETADANRDYLIGKLSKDSTIYKNLPQQLKDRGLELPASFQHMAFDLDDTALETLQGVNTAIKEQLKKEPIDVFTVKKTMIRKTLVHEIGHTLGLAHNFKSNIMPEKGSVPEAIYQKLLEKAQQNMINKSSIMGYPNAKTVVLTPYEEMIPGPHDIHRIRLLYNQEYPMYDKSSNGQSKYVWQKLGQDGKIADQLTLDGKRLTPGYLPSCNDIEASLYLDPFCNRHDRGYNAQTLVDSYFTDFWDSLYKSLESNIDALKSRNYRAIENYLWWISANTLSRTRYFHDFMRLKYADQIKQLRSQNGDIIATYKNILSFSKSCRALKGLNSSELSGLRTNNEYKNFISRDSSGQYVINEFGDLCLATAAFFDNINKLLEIEGKEYTEIDYFNRHVTLGAMSGDVHRDNSQMFGSWKRISLLPLKIKVMHNVLLPFSLMSSRYGDYLLYPYNRPDTSFSMSSLYPEEYLKVIRSLIESAMRIDDKDSEPRISRSLLYLGYYSRFQNMSGDYSIFPSEILDAIQDQTNFRFSSAFIEVEANKIDGSEFAKTFKGSIYNRYNTVGKEALGSVYLYSLDRFVMKAQANSLVLPVSPIRWRSNSSGLAFGIKLDYAPNINFEELESFSPRNYFIDKYENVLKQCIQGEADNGLSSYFNTTTDFEGIKIPYDIHERASAYKELNDSIVSNLSDFVTAKDFDLSDCENAIKTQRALVLGAALTSGLMFPETMKHLEQGGN